MDNIIERINIKLEDELMKKFPDHQERYEFAANFCKSGDYVVDVACGCGYGTNILSQKSDNKTIGLDVDSDALQWVNKYGEGNSNFLKITNGSFPLKEKIADVIVSLETIEHVAKPEKFFI